MEAQLGRLAGVIRTKDAEAAALSAAVQRQFAERTELRGHVAALDGQVGQLRGANADLEARLRGAEERWAVLDAKHNRCDYVVIGTLRLDAHQVWSASDALQTWCASERGAVLGPPSA